MNKPTAAAAAASEAGAWHALVIGINSYVNVEWNLDGAVSDALAMKKLLVDQLGIPGDNVRLHVSPQDQNPDPTAASTVDSRALHLAFENMKRAVGKDDHMVLYYAGHGVRVSSRTEKGSLWVFGLAPSDFAFTAPERMITSFEITSFLEELADRGVRVTAFFDCCHSGGSIRGSDATRLARGIAGESVAEAWAALPRWDDAIRPENGSATGSGWVRARDPGAGRAEWAVMSACCADQKAAEVYDQDDAPRGAFTLALLRALKDVSSLAQARELRWMELHDKVRAQMAANRSGQLPTLEGIAESLVFGGQFQPFDPGFNVTNQPPQAGGVPRLHLDGGSMQGLDRGAVLRIYPPGTADFETAKPTVDVRIDDAELASSTAPAPEGIEVEDGSRARLVAHGRRGRRMSVRLTDLPTDIVKDVVSCLDATAIRIVAAEVAEFDVEVVRWEGPIPSWRHFTPRDHQPAWVGTSGGWALVSASSTRTRVTADDVIAYLPSVVENGTPWRVGFALARGLAHLARYLDVLGRKHSDPVLDRYLEVKLCKGPEKARTGDEKYKPLSRNEVGVFEVNPGDHLWVELRVKKGLPGGLFVGVLECSNDGSIELLWPDDVTSRLGLADDEEGLSKVQIKRVGSPRRHRCLSAGVRNDQQSTERTFKVIAYANTTEARDTVDLRSLELPDTVQEVIATWLKPGIVGACDQDALPGPIWVTRELVIRSRR